MFRRVNFLKQQKDRAPKAIRAFDIVFSNIDIVYRFRRTVVGTLGARGGSLVTRVA